MPLEIIVRGKVAKNCFQRKNIQGFKRHVEEYVRKRLELGADDKVIVEVIDEK